MAHHHIKAHLGIADAFGMQKAHAEVQPDQLVFSGRAGAAPIGAGAIRELYVRAGFAGRGVEARATLNERRSP